MTITAHTHTLLMECRTYILDAFQLEAKNRKNTEGLDWVDNERIAITIAANDWATAHGFNPITVTEVAKVENMAVGHSDYGTKFALYVAELVVHPELVVHL